MKNQLAISVLLLLFSSLSIHAAEKTSLELVLKSILQGVEKTVDAVDAQSRQYTNYCGNETNKKYRESGWTSLQECLKDGRVHLVYQVDETDGSAFGDFEKTDLNILLKAINDGADISVTEHSKNADGINVNYKCVSATAQNGLGICSSAAFNWPTNPSSSSRSTILFRTSTDGVRQYIENYFTIQNGVVKNEIMSGKFGRVTENNVGASQTWIKSYSWFIRY